MEVSGYSSAKPTEGTLRPCGSCSLCCKVFKVVEVEKEAHEWCRHYAAGIGCSIHADRPKVCRGYQCLWTIDHSLGEEWQPSRCGFVVHWAPSRLGLWVNVDLDHAGAWRKEPFYSQIKIWSEMVRHRTGIVAVTEGPRSFVIFPEQDLEVNAPTGGQITAGYRRSPGWRQPFARFAKADGSEQEFVGVPIPERR